MYIHFRKTQFRVPCPKLKNAKALLRSTKERRICLWQREKEIYKSFLFPGEENKLIRRKMIESKTKNMGAYLRKMAIDGYIVNTDTTPLKKQYEEMHKIGVNINQIAKKGKQHRRSVSGRNARIERDGERIMAYLKIFPIKVTDKKALDYITNPDKTDEKLLVSSFGCSPETADLNFL